MYEMENGYTFAELTDMHLIYGEARDVGKVTHEMRMRNPELYVLLRVGGSNMSTETAEALVKSADRRAVFSASVARIVKEADINGIEITFPLDAKGGSKHSKGGLVALAKLYLESEEVMQLYSRDGWTAAAVTEQPFHKIWQFFPQREKL